MTHYTDGIPGAIVHFDVLAAGYNTQTAKQIEQEAAAGASAAYNTNAGVTDATRSRYLDQEAGRVRKIIEANTTRTVLAVELPNGLGEFARLDKNGKVVSTYWDVIEK